ncbi:MAG TPA: alkaline phosphatase family protein [Allosphingosinicella sp.]
MSTIFVLMMENRSFDHLLGYLALHRGDVEGLSSDPAWRDKVASTYGGKRFPPSPLTDPYDAIAADPPHGRADITTQLGQRVGDIFPMDGFVSSYATAKGLTPIAAGSEPPVMGYFTAEHAPVTAFLAQHYAICDHWHAALPAGTQPNRLMAMSGFTRIEDNKTPLPNQELVYDWLTKRGIRWRVYHVGIPFFALMLDRVGEVLGPHFRPFAEFFEDVESEPPDEFPQVVFLEPAYSDAPHIGPSCDDHSPAGIKGGQEFVLEAYRALTRSPDLWNQSAMIVSYDEHGGFFDHVSPPLIETLPPADALYKQKFTSLGVRVPALVISPFVVPGSVHHALMDHTSILKFIGDTFDGGSYSPLVDARPVGSVSAVLTNAGRDSPAPVIGSLEAYLALEPKPGGRVPNTKPETPIQENFQQALDAIRNHPARPPGAYDDLLQADFPH